MCLNETWLNSEIKDCEVSIPGYDIIRNDRPTYGGGVALYVRNDLKIIERDDIHRKHNVDSCWVEVIHKDNKNILIGTIYRPPAHDLDYYDKMLDLLSMVTTECKDIVLLGDFNLNSYDNVSARSIDSIQKMFDITQLVTSPTRQAVKITRDGRINHSNSLIDLIFTTMPNSHYNTCVIKTTISDHFLVKTKIHFSKVIKHKTVTFRDYKNFNQTDFKQAIMEFLEQNDIHACNDIERCWQIFKDGFINISNIFAPLVTRRLKPRKCPWITIEIVRNIHERDYYHKLYWKTKSEVHRNQYKAQRNFVTSLIRNTKRKYYEDKVNSNLNNPNKLWKIFNEVLSSKQKHSCPAFFTPNQFNNHFCSVGENIANSFENQDKSFPWKNPASIYAFKFQEIKHNNVRELLEKLSDSSSLDILNFDSKLLKIASEEITPVLTYIFNLSIRGGVFCSDWKIARVTPAYKDRGSKSDMNNYRPISCITHIAKILERLINKQVMDYLTKYSFISEDQSAYRTKYSTVTALHRVTEDWLSALNESQQIAVIYLDTKKCFDSIDHEILLEKLKCYGIKCNELQWFKSYLSRRTQKVFMENRYSDEGVLKYGVPQGSILGPTLFLLYINDISQYGIKATINIYSDDVLIYYASADINDLNKHLQDSLDNISYWYEKNRLVLSAEKCGVMLVTNKTNVEEICLRLNDDMLQQVDHFKYLGVYLDCHLTFNSHVLKKVSQMKSKLSFLRRLSTYLPQVALNKVYKALILPSLDYAITVWGQTSINNVNLLYRQEKLAARILCNDFDFINTRGDDLCNSLGWKNFNERLKFAISCTLYKAIHGLLPQYLCDPIIFDFEVHGYHTRGAINNNLHLPFPKNEKFKQSLYYNGAVIWNNLENMLRDSTSFTMFKRQYKLIYF